MPHPYSANYISDLPSHCDLVSIWREEKRADTNDTIPSSTFNIKLELNFHQLVSSRSLFVEQEATTALGLQLWASVDIARPIIEQYINARFSGEQEEGDGRRDWRTFIDRRWGRWDKQKRKRKKKEENNIKLG